MEAVNPAVSCKKNKPRLNEFPEYLGFSQGNIYIYTWISLIDLNIWNPLRDMAENQKYTC